LLNHFSICYLLISLLAVIPVVAQTPPGPPVVARTYSENLERCRVAILDPALTWEQRKLWAEQIVSYESDEVIVLIEELLRHKDRPYVQRALCQVLVERATREPAALHRQFVDPLLALLGSEDEALRAEAARTLAAYANENVPQRLGELAADASAPKVKRLAAVDALAPNIHRQEVVAQLIALFDAEDPELTARVASVLEPAAREALGTDADKWKSWWASKRDLSREDWSADRREIYRGYYHAQTRALQQCREEAKKRHTAITQRMREYQREAFRALPADERDTRLAEWLVDPLPEVALSALDIIKTRIAEEGRRPEGELLAALLRLLREGEPSTRRDVLLIVQNLGDAVVMDAILEQLTEERDIPTRVAIFRAIGKINRPEAVPALVEEISSADASLECVREAAIALGQVAEKVEGQVLDGHDAEALKQRYANLSRDNVDVRGALLTAMAGIKSADFTPEFIDAVRSNEPVLLRPAIRGLQHVGDRSELQRLRDLTAHADALVRLAAIEAVGAMGGGEADLQSLHLRLNPSIEPNSLARQAAWREVKELLATRSAPERLRYADRLRDTPELEVEYLVQLVDDLTRKGERDLILEARRRLANVLVEQENFAGALPHLRELFLREEGQDAAERVDAGLVWLNAALAVPSSVKPGDIGSVVAQIFALNSEPVIIDRVVAIIRTGLARVSDEDREALRSRLRNELRDVTVAGLPESWSALRAELDEGPNDPPTEAPNP